MKTTHLLQFLLAALLFSNGLQAGLPPEYNAVYDLNKFGLHAAQASSSLQRQADGSWLYRSQTETRGVVSIFRKDRIIEQTVLKQVAGKIRPISYQYIHHGSKKNRNRSISFDWDHMQADSTVSGTRSTLSIGPDTIDNFSMQLKLMLDLKSGKHPLIYNIIRKGKISDYEFDILGNEKIESDAGAFDTIKIKRSRKDSKRTTIMWAAPELHFLPVKIQHIEPDGSQFSLLMKSISGKITEKTTPPGLTVTSE